MTIGHLLGLEELTIWVQGEQHRVTGLTKNTTCGQVIKALCQSWKTNSSAKTSSSPGVFAPAAAPAQAPSISSPLDTRGTTDDLDCWRRFVMVERWRRVERPLEADTKILKLWRRWAEEQKHVRFLLKKVNHNHTHINNNKICSSTRGSSTKKRSSLSLLPSLLTKSVRKSVKNDGNRKLASLVVPRPDRRLSNVFQPAGTSLGRRSSISSIDGRNLGLTQLTQQWQSQSQNGTNSSLLENHVVSAAEQLRRLVAVQKETLRRQRRHLAKTDAAIDAHETKVHLTRVARMGEDYVQEVYLGEDGQEANLLSRFLHPRMTPEDQERRSREDDVDNQLMKNSSTTHRLLEEKSLLETKFLELSRRLEREKSRLRDLSERIRVQRRVYEEESQDDDNFCWMLDKARSEVTRLSLLAQSQETTVEQNQETDQEWRRLVTEKGDACRRLEDEERHLDEEMKLLTAAKDTLIFSIQRNSNTAGNSNKMITVQTPPALSDVIRQEGRRSGSWKYWRRRRYGTRHNQLPLALTPNPNLNHNYRHHSGTTAITPLNPDTIEGATLDTLV